MGPKEFDAYMQHVLDTQFTPAEKSLKKSIIKKLNKVQKKRGRKIFKEESVNERWNPNKIKSHTSKAINFLKQAQSFARQGQKGAVWNRLKDAGWELKQVMAFTESVNEGHTITFSKEEMAKLHKDGKIEKDGHTYVYTEN